MKFLVMLAILFLVKNTFWKVILILAVAIYAQNPNTTYLSGVDCGCDSIARIEYDGQFSGLLFAEVPVKDGIIQGDLIAYYPSGALMAVVSESGNTGKMYFENGELMAEQSQEQIYSMLEVSNVR